MYQGCRDTLALNEWTMCTKAAAQLACKCTVPKMKLGTKRDIIFNGSQQLNWLAIGHLVQEQTKLKGKTNLCLILLSKRSRRPLVVTIIVVAIISCGNHN